MKITITKPEVEALIRGAFNLPSDTEIEIVDNKDADQDNDGWIINTQTEPFPPYTLDGDELLDIVYNNGDVYPCHPTCTWTHDWNTNNDLHIVKYRKHRG